METFKGLVNIIPLKQQGGVPGVLGGNKVALLQGADSTVGDILQIADGGADQIEITCHLQGPPVRCSECRNRWDRNRDWIHQGAIRR